VCFARISGGGGRVGGEDEVRTAELEQLERLAVQRLHDLEVVCRRCRSRKPRVAGSGSARSRALDMPATLPTPFWRDRMSFRPGTAWLSRSRPICTADLYRSALSDGQNPRVGGDPAIALYAGHHHVPARTEPGSSDPTHLFEIGVGLYLHVGRVV
jgi:hypothetical protein